MRVIRVLLMLKGLLRSLRSLAMTASPFRHPMFALRAAEGGEAIYRYSPRHPMFAF